NICNAEFYMTTVCTFKFNDACMNQFLLQQGVAGELHLFPHIIEFALRKNHSIQLDSFPETVTETIRIYYIIEGKFEWLIQGRSHSLYPGDLVMLLPGQKLAGSKNFL